MSNQKNLAAPAGPASMIARSADDPDIKKLVAEAARIARTEYCSRCDISGGPSGRLCKPSGIHYGRVLAAHIARKITDAQLVAVQVALGSPIPYPETLLTLEPWQV